MTTRRLEIARRLVQTAGAMLFTAAAWGTEVKAWQSAETAYERGHYAAALEGYLHLAKNGDARAAELAGLMLLYGDRLYTSQVRSDPQRAAELLMQSALGGSLAAQSLLRQPRAVPSADASRAGARDAARSAEEPYVPGPFGC